MRCAVFSPLATLLGFGNRNRRRAQTTGWRTIIGPASGYIKARARIIQSSARIRRGIQTQRGNSLSVPRTARARATDAPRITRPVALTPWQSQRHRWQAKRATFHLRHNGRVKKGAPRFSNSYPFLFPLSLDTGTEKGDILKGILPREGNGPPSPPTDQGFEGWPLGRVRQPPQSTRAPRPPTDQGFEGWPLRRVRQPPQSTRAPCPLLIRGSQAGPSKGFDSHPRTRRVRDDPGYVRYMAEARATLPRYPMTFSRPAGTTRNGIPPEGGIEPSDPVEKGPGPANYLQVLLERFSGPLADP
jgi:hypothetical protein